MPMFCKKCAIGIQFKKWLQSPGGGGKPESQADQILCRILKNLKFCCKDVETSWELPETVLDYCLGSLSMLSDIVKHLQKRLKNGKFWNNWLHACDWTHA